jgi:anti-sigma factor RsiW
MNERQNSPGCERASDLIAFLYDEADEREARDFQAHLQQCSSCREEVASFGVVRQSITAWRDEALAGFISSPVAAHLQKKSALAALRQFFDLSPLWLKGATAFAAVTFCVLVGLVLRSDNNHVSSTNINPGAVYTAQDVDRMVKEALAQQPTVKPRAETKSEVVVAVKPPKPKVKSARVTSRPLSKEEREQLAAELRLSSDDDATLHLLEDRINQ